MLGVHPFTTCLRTFDTDNKLKPMKLHTLIPLLLILLTPVLVVADPTPNETVSKPAPASTRTVQWRRWTPAAFEKARQESKLVLVDLTADWCSFCKKMDRTTWKDSDVLGSISNHYIPVRVQDEVDTKLADQYRSYGRPAFVVLDADGNEIARKRGYLAPKWMHWMLEGIAENPTAEANR